MRAVRLVVALLFAGTLPTAAVDVYVAFGDSITRGTGAPVAPEIIFDCPIPGDTDCTASSSPETCGYVDKLEVALPGNENVINEGRGGETTAGGVSRINGALNARCPGSPGNCVAVLLMEGTNDPGNGLAPEDTKANLSTMITRIEARNVDVLLMTIIRKVYAPGNFTWNAMRNNILSLGSQRSIPTVDVYQGLCANTACFNSQYWVAGATPCNHPTGDSTLGHLDTDGYQSLVDVFLEPVFPAAVPPAPAITAPSGDILDDEPTFTWPEVPEARWYHLQVDNGATLDAWRKAVAVCSDGTCAVTAPAPLPGGAHTWRVQGRNLRGRSAWSTTKSFTLWNTLPGTPVPTAPTTDSCQGTSGPYTATFEWDEASDAKNYRIQVTEVSTASVVIDETVSSSGTCDGGSCAATPTTALWPGEYSWRVMATNPAGSGPWSTDTAFSLFPSALTAPTPTYPVDDVFDTTPTYRWQGRSGDEEYDLDVDGGVTTHSAGAACVSFACAVTGAAIGVGPHIWAVSAKNRCTPGVESASVGFDLLECAAYPDLVVGDSTPPPFAACQTLSTAASGFTVGSGATVTFHAGDTIRLGDGFAVLSGGTFSARVDY